MANYFSKRELEQVESAEHAYPSPVPTQCISNGEFNPLPQSEQQRQVEARIKELADKHGQRQGLTRREFLTTSCGMAAAFVAMNEVYGGLFDVSEAEAAEVDRSEERARALASQFILDDQTHFVHDDFTQEGILGLAQYAKEHWNPALSDPDKLNIYKFENFVRQIFLNSDTSVALLSGAPFDDESWTFLTNDAIKEAVRLINNIAGTDRMLGHALVTPGQDGWMDRVDYALENLQPDSWKMYTIGDPLSAKTKYPWRLDDEDLVYPFYEKAVKAGITTICIHKGLMPADYEQSWANVWQYNTVWDVGKAAKDWPDINFVIYHGGLRAFLESPDTALAKFEETGEIEWASDLARIREEHGVSNVYAEMGTSFANSATANPRFAAAVMGTWIKGLGVDHVVWGTDSVLYGSPQWQIEAFRRLEIPEDMREKHGFAALGGADSATKNQIFGYNSARLYNLELRAALPRLGEDQFAQIKRDYQLAGGLHNLRDNKAYGYIVKQTA
ncbi:MAG: amidohydrolase family protein [Gammaproteobacteria bacterium]